MFRLQDAPKRIFWSVDHQTDEEIIEQSYPEIRRAGSSLNTVAVRSDFLIKYKKAKLELIAKCSHLQGYELAPPDQIPTQDLALAQWLIRNQSRAFGTNQVTFLDFRAPIEIEALIVPNNLL